MTKVICHRGYSGFYPENTALAFRKALTIGADGMEMDVHLTKDGEVVVIHDELVDRTTDGTGFVKDMTFRELRRLNAAARWGSQCTPQKILTLQEYFELVGPYRFFTNVEFKTGTFDYAGIEEKVWDIVCAYGQEENVLFSSFHAQTLLRLQEICPQIPMGLLNQEKLANPGHVVKDLLHLQAYHPHFVRLTPEVIRDLKAHDLRINTYTPNDRATLTYLLRQGITGVITNYPEKAMALRQRIQK